MAKLKITRDYGKARAAAYPPLGDALDALSKGLRAVMDSGVKLPADTVAWVQACEAVKTRFRKPTK